MQPSWIRLFNTKTCTMQTVSPGRPLTNSLTREAFDQQSHQGGLWPSVSPGRPLTGTSHVLWSGSTRIHWWSVLCSWRRPYWGWNILWSWNSVSRALNAHATVSYRCTWPFRSAESSSCHQFCISNDTNYVRPICFCAINRLGISPRNWQSLHRRQSLNHRNQLTHA